MTCESAMIFCYRTCRAFAWHGHVSDIQIHGITEVCIKNLLTIPVKKLLTLSLKFCLPSVLKYSLPYRLKICLPYLLKFCLTFPYTNTTIKRIVQRRLHKASPFPTQYFLSDLLSNPQVSLTTP